MIHQFDHRFGTYEGQTQAQANKGFLPQLSAERKSDPTELTLPKYWASRRDVNVQILSLSKQETSWLLVFRGITTTTNERTTIAAAIPYSAAVDPLMVVMTVQSAEIKTCLLANLNSFVTDFVSRQKVSSTHLTFFIIKQLPIIPPERYTPALLDQIVPRVLELTYTARDLEPFAKDCGYDGPPFGWDEGRRLRLRSELDGIYAHLYGLSRDDFAYILDTFPIVRRHDEVRHGEFLTKRLCLDAYDRFKGSIG